MPDDQIQDHRGTWVRAEVAERLQAQVAELTAEVQRLQSELDAAKAPPPAA